MSADKSYWKEVLREARRKLEDLQMNRRHLEQRLQEMNSDIVEVERLIGSLTSLSSDDPEQIEKFVIENPAEIGLTDACREILKQSTHSRTPRGIRDSLEASGYDITQHTNPLASIHSILKRLIESGEVDQIESKTGTMYYRWKGQPKLEIEPSKISVKLSKLSELKDRKIEK